jgi:RNA polymerase sigma-70 factor (ECF subfamily)
MPSAAQDDSGTTIVDPEIAAAATDPAARWRTLETCRDYLRLVACRDRWKRRSDEPGTSDLIQHTILEGWRAFPHFEGRTSGQLRAWLRAMLVHALLKSKRRPIVMQSDAAGAADIIPGTGTSPSHAAQRNLSREALDAALGVLSERHRVVIRLRIWDQMPFTEVGARLGISEDAARMLYGRALASLRESMRPGHDPG